MRFLLLAITFMLTLSACGGSDENTIQQSLDARNSRIIAASASWPTEPNYDEKFVALTPIGDAPTDGSARATFDAADDYWGLPRTGEYELVAAYCAGCHSLEIVMQQLATRKRWDYMLRWMSEEQGMVPLEPEDHEAILSYLVEYFGAT